MECFFLRMISCYIKIDDYDSDHSVLNVWLWMYYDVNDVFVQILLLETFGVWGNDFST